MAQKILYQEKYKKDVCIRADLLPESLPPFHKNLPIERMELKAAGRIELDGKIMEFADLRVFVIPENV